MFFPIFKVFFQPENLGLHLAMSTDDKYYGVFDVFADFQSFFQPENLGLHLAMSTDDRFLP